MEFQINKNIVEDTVRLYLTEKTAEGRKVISPGEKPNQFIINIVQSGQEIKPFLELHGDMFEDLVQAVLQYADKNNIKSEKQSYLEGELEATKKHLEDSRKIVNNLLKIK